MLTRTCQHLSRPCDASHHPTFCGFRVPPCATMCHHGLEEQSRPFKLTLPCADGADSGGQFIHSFISLESFGYGFWQVSSS